MSKPLRLLLVEDSERDAALLSLYLRRGGYQPAVQRVETAADMQTHLAAQEWDVIISDVNLPRFSALAALDVLRRSGCHIPFLVVSGEADEKVIAEIRAAGATEFLGKDQMAQIVAAIDRAMQAAS
jgi:phosphoserine phosphatase RsbU/P